MATINYTFKGMQKSECGTARKDGLDYAMRELTRQWKIVNVTGTHTVEFVWYKKDIPTFEEWCAELTKDGYGVLLAE